MIQYFFERSIVIIIRNTRLVKLFTCNSPWVVAIALFPFIFIRTELPANTNEAYIIRHEAIHIRQQMELAVVLFYAWYIIEYFRHRFRGMTHFDAYRNIMFEKEAHANMHRTDYLSERKAFAFWTYRSPKEH